LVNLVPSMRMLSLPGSFERFAESLRGQLDFRLEAENNRRFAKNFAHTGDVDVPALYPELCSRRVLAMDFIDGVKATDTDAVLGDRKKLARIGGETVLQMVFVDAFVHADLHPGNILLTADSRVVLIDLGMVTEIPPGLRRPWIETFVALSQKDGAQAARLFFMHAPTIGRTVYADFERDVVEQLQPILGKKLGEIEVGQAVSGMMNVLRRHQVQVDPSYTVVNIAMLVAEGLGKQLDPEIDLMTLAIPYLMRAMETAPPGREPFRMPPDAPAPPALPKAVVANTG
jgi:ubiquinone biosynthesis protein